MISLRKILFTVSLLLLVIPGITFAEEPEKIEKIIVSGVGLDADKAKVNAIRNAVEQVIGSYVASDTLVNNSQLVKDEILSYSGGFVKDTRVVSQEKSTDGLFTVQIEATVVSTKIKRKLESLNIATKKVEGESLFGESISRIKEQIGASELLGKTLGKYPQAAYKVEVGKPEIKSTDPNKNMAKIAIPLTIRWDNAFIAEIRDVASKVALEELRLKDLDYMTNYYPLLRGKNSGKNKALCFSQRNVIRGGIAEVCAIIPTDIYTDAISKAGLKDKYNLISPPVSSHNMSLTLTFKNKAGGIISMSNHEFDREDSDTPSKQGILRDKRENNSSDILFLDEGFTPPNTLWRDLYGRNILLLTDGIFQMTVEAEVETSLLSNITSIEVNLNSWQIN